MMTRALLLTMLLPCCVGGRVCDMPLRVTPDPELLDLTLEAAKLMPWELVVVADDGVPIRYTPDYETRGYAWYMIGPDRCTYDMWAVIADPPTTGVIVHELGELLGLEHVNRPGCFMHEEIQPNPRWCLESLNHLEAVYGRPN